MDYSIKIGGEAGQGLQTIGNTLAKVFSRFGYHVFTHQDYESRIRGGHNYYQVRLSDKPVMVSRDKIDILVALDKESISLHEKELSENGQVIYDSSLALEIHNKTNFLDIPFEKLSLEFSGNKIMANTVAIGAVLGILGLKLDVLLGIISDTFKSKGHDIITANIKAAMAGHDFAVKHRDKCSFSPTPESNPKMLINGVDAIGLGALSGGCKFYAAYPMTPSTGVMLYMASKAEEYGVIVEQAEDEIAAINMVLGASFAGVRAMTGTSGGGFALMVEGLSLAGMTETPVVIALGQRPGPATGFPTRTEQGDLLFALHAGHGEFPRVIFAPGTPEQLFYLTNKAFDLAEKYQIPALVIFDHYLADAEWTFDSFDLNKIKYTDHRIRGDAFKSLSDYKRHAFTDTGVSDLGIPGDSTHVVVTDSDEHDEEGHMIEDAETRKRMIDKRLFKKLPLIRQEMEPPTIYGERTPEIVVVGWGSTYGVMKEAVDVLSTSKSIAMLHFSEVYPLPSTAEGDFRRLLGGAKQTICIENNATGQFEQFLKTEAGCVFNARCNKYDGRPFILEELLGELNAHIGRI
ncbi:MAG: 2-oxoacid:acceptor oxidoreductase subunit alpha [Dissulfurispiraceae bacterium]